MVQFYNNFGYKYIAFYMMDEIEKWEKISFVPQCAHLLTNIIR